MAEPSAAECPLLAAGLRGGGCGRGGGEAKGDSSGTLASGIRDWATSLPDSSSEGSCDTWSSIEAVAWDKMWLGHAIEPAYKYARCTEDVHLLSVFLELSELKEIDPDAVKLLLRAIKFLRLCDYSGEDICSILAHASAYFVDTHAHCGSQMDAREVGNVLASLLFVAHSYVQDETCPLKVWHQYLFRRYCPLATLNAAIVRLMEIRRFMLRLTDHELRHRFGRLLSVIRGARDARKWQHAWGVCPAARRVGGAQDPAPHEHHATVGGA